MDQVSHMTWGREPPLSGKRQWDRPSHGEPPIGAAIPNSPEAITRTARTGAIRARVAGLR